METHCLMFSPMLRDLEILAITHIVREEARPWFLFFKKAMQAMHVHIFVGLS